MAQRTKDQKLTAADIAGYIPGTWSIDPVHSDVSFSVRHMMVAKVRGRFQGVTGTIVLAPDPAGSHVTAEIDMATIDTGNADRDNDVKSAAYLDVARFPTMTFRSGAVRTGTANRVEVEGELTVHGVTRPVTLWVEVNGFGKDAWGGTRCGFTATTQIDRTDYGVTTNMPLDGGGMVIGDTIQITLEIEATLDRPA